MPVPVRKYRDLDLSFAAHPVTGQLAVLSEVDSVRRSVRNLVLTSHYERPFRPWIGCNVQNSLFGPSNLVTEQQIRQSIEDVINREERRAILQQIKVAFLEKPLLGYEVTIVFSVRNIPEPIELTLFLRRTR